MPTVRGFSGHIGQIVDRGCISGLCVIIGVAIACRSLSVGIYKGVALGVNYDKVPALFVGIYSSNPAYLQASTRFFYMSFWERVLVLFLHIFFDE